MKVRKSCMDEELDAFTQRKNSTLECFNYFISHSCSFNPTGLENCDIIASSFIEKSLFEENQNFLSIWRSMTRIMQSRHDKIEFEWWQEKWFVFSPGKCKLFESFAFVVVLPFSLGPSPFALRLYSALYIRSACWASIGLNRRLWPMLTWKRDR